MIYFIQDPKSGAIKIGISKDPIARMRELQTAHAYKLHLIGVMDGGRDEEQSLHQRFQCLNGEWFAPTPELLNLIRCQAVLISRLKPIGSQGSPIRRHTSRLSRKTVPSAIPVKEGVMAPIDLGATPYDHDMLWLAALCAVQKRESGEYRFTVGKIARLISQSTSIPRSRQQSVCADMEQIVLTIRSMPAEEVDAILVNVPESTKLSLTEIRPRMPGVIDSLMRKLSIA